MYRPPCNVWFKDYFVELGYLCFDNDLKRGFLAISCVEARKALLKYITVVSNPIDKSNMANN